MIGQLTVREYEKENTKVLPPLYKVLGYSIKKDELQSRLRYILAGAYKELIFDIASHSYTAKSFGKFKYLYRIMGIFGRIKDKQRIAIQAISCLRHDSLAVLEKINCPALIIGAEEDDVLGVESSLELHQHIKDSQLNILPDCGHAIYEEQKDFQKRVLIFLES